MAETAISIDDIARVYTAVGHPIRLRILLALTRGDVDRLSPRGFVAANEDLTLGTVAYHFRDLLSDGLIELAGERPVRGAVEHFYRATGRGRGALRPLDALPATHREVAHA